LWKDSAGRYAWDKRVPGPMRGGDPGSGVERAMRHVPFLPHPDRRAMVLWLEFVVECSPRKKTRMRPRWVKTAGLNDH